MKFNLKNRPRRVQGQVTPVWYWVNDIGKVLSNQEIEVWFVGFEKELRDQIAGMKTRRSNDGLNLDRLILTHQLKEILGDSDE